MVGSWLNFLKGMTNKKTQFGSVSKKRGPQNPPDVFLHSPPYRGRYVRDGPDRIWRGSLGAIILCIQNFFGRRIFNELAPEDERLCETERAAWKFVKENNDNSFKCTEDRMNELTNMVA